MDFKLTVPTLASNCWPAQPQTLVNEIFDKTRGQLQDITGVVRSTTEPGIDDRDKGWIKLDSNGRPVGIYSFGAGAWTWPHEVPANSSFRWLWVGNEPDVWAIDGGDGTDPRTVTPSATTGAMWEVDHAFDGRIPMGPGTIPDVTPATSLAVGANYGSGTSTLASNQVPAHTHPLVAPDSSLQNGDNIKVAVSGSGSSGLLAQTTGSATALGDMSIGPNDPGTQAPINQIPPVRGIFVIKRTLRTHRVA